MRKLSDYIWIGFLLESGSPWKRFVENENFKSQFTQVQVNKAGEMGKTNQM